MYLYEMPDISEKITGMLNSNNLAYTELRDVLLNFLNALDSDFREKVLNEIIEFLEIDETADEVFSFISNAFTSVPWKEEDCNKMIFFAKGIAECAESEDCCENKIYVVIKGIDDSDYVLVNEYNSYEEAEKETDELYTSCCDDIFWGENVLFPILCSVQMREWDYAMNFCTVYEYDATGIEESRESWEEENCPDDE